MADFDPVQRSLLVCFSGVLPARTTVASALKGITVEIDAIARKAD